MDADEAADFVGGSENKVIQRQDVIKKTSFAVRALLGLDVFEKAKKRVRKIAEEFGRAATKAIGDEELNRQQQELDRLRKDLEKADSQVKEDRHKKTEIEDKLDRARDKLEALVGNMGAKNALQERLRENRLRRRIVGKQRLEEVGKLSRENSRIELLASVARREISSVRALLQPMYDDGSIPSRHIAFVKELIERGVCVCGQELKAESDYRRHVEHALEKSQAKAEKADYLADVLQAANALHQFDEDRWMTRCEGYEQQIADLDQEIVDLDTAKREIDKELGKIEVEEVQNTRNEISMLETQKEDISLSLARNSESSDRYRKQVNEMDGKIRAQVRRQSEARDYQACQQTATVLVEIFEQAYATIRDSQLEELDTEMNRLFAKMAANVSDEDFEFGDQRKSSLRMIEQVGLQSVSGEADEFEIFAHNRRGRLMPPTEINGASRRILALSFVLALCKVSRTYAPLVADSLLNFMSGSVRSNTLRVTAETASQPILLLTGSDLESQREVELVAQYAGATYTLTGQWQHTGHDGDVVNLTDERRVALICSCGPREYCTVCERAGQADSLGWQRNISLEDSG